MCLKTYIIQYTHSNGNGWAIINCPSPSFIENILKKQSKMLNVQVVSYNELRYFGEEMGLVYEGCITTIGQSPYDIAVANGFRGSVTEWLDSLKGEQGVQGIQGPQGPQGLQGIQGETGPKGSDGQDGIGVPSGGLTGQVLKKKSDSNYDTEWGEVGGVGNVESVNGKTGVVVLNANDVGALPSNTPLFSGDYNDLSNKPTIPAALSQLSEDTTHRTVSDTEKTTWGNKQEALVSGTNIKTINNESVLGSGNISVAAELPSNLAYISNDDGQGIIPSDGIRAESVTSAAAMTINPDVVTVINGAVGTATITLQVPNDNLAHVWDILMTTDSTVAITFAMSNSAAILYPDGFSVAASKAVEVSVIGVGNTYYLRYGEFA